MANWIGLLKSVPWGEVADRAPQIAEGAKSLWGAVTRHVRGDQEAAPTVGEPPPTPGTEARVAALEADLRETREQLRASAALIDALAGQNRALVERLAAVEGRLRWVAGLALAALLGAALTAFAVFA